MKMKGHNAMFPCCYCHIQGIWTPYSTNNILYIPLDCHRHPDHGTNPSYDPLSLPHCTHDEVIQQVMEVEGTLVKAHWERLTMCINGLLSLSKLSSIQFPSSFPYDFMHLVWENLIPNMVELWTGSYRSLLGSNFEISPTIWDKIGHMTYECGMLIPSQFGVCVPNIKEKSTYFTTENWSFWTLFITPVVLQSAFSHQVYYEHFMELVQLVKLCVDFQIHSDNIMTLWTGIATWVQQFEM